jgi:TonB-dependent SusC/RagA subfamily outer membrane receptor
MKTKHILVLLPLLVGLLAAFRLPGLLPSEFLNSLTEKTRFYTDKLPSEKLYLQTDKTFFKPGEDIWFSAYLVNGTDHTAQAASHVVYVELINPRGNVEKTLTLLAQKNHLHGDFHLDESAPGGIYKLRAYTQWMKNAGEEAFFQKEIQVQKVLTPRLLLKLEFERKAYGAGAQVVADLEMKDLKNNPLNNQTVRYYVLLAGNPYLQANAMTDASGKASIRFSLPADLQTTDGLLNITTEHDGNPESIARSIPIVLNEIALQFFPEGGNLVAHVPGRVAFKATNEFGKPADIEGYITDKSGIPVSQFKSFHHGMGAFAFTPLPDQTYQVHLTKPATTQIYALPEVVAKGYTLRVDSVEKQRMQVSFHSPVSKTVYVVAQVRGNIYFTKEIQARTGLNNFEIPLHDFPIGVAQVTLFDYNQIPRCERLAFVNAHRKMHIAVTTDKKQYAPREKVELTVRTTDEDSLPVPAQLSLSVADDRLLSFADDKQDNILSYLLMSSDLKGVIDEPSFYFKPNEPKAPQALDYVLLTHGWRRFTWQQVTEGPRATVFLPETTGSLSGVILDAQTFQPLSATVTLFELDEKRRSAQLKTGPSGRFVFQQVNPKVPLQVFAQAGSVSPTHILIRLDQESANPNMAAKATKTDFAWQQEIITEKAVAAKVSPQPAGEAKRADKIVSAKNEKPAADAEEVSLGELSLSADIQSLSEVVVVGYGQQEKKDVTGAVAIIATNELFPPSNLQTQLQGRIAGIQVVQSDGAPGSDTRVQVRGSGSFVQSNPLYVVDGVPTDNPELVSTGDIESITVIKSGQAAALYGSRGSQGVIAITTKKREYYRRSIAHNKLPMSQLYIAERKFSVVREFFSPVYDPRKPVTERNDFRSTIYWNPVVQTDARTGTTHLSFYNSDQVSSFRIITEGLSTHGLVGRSEITYATQLPFNIEAKIPPYLTFEDIVSIPITLKNTTQKPIHGTLTIQAPPQLKITAFDGAINSIPGQTKTLYLQAEVLPIAGKGTLKLLFEGSGFQETIAQEIEVQPKGFPTEMAYSGKEKDAQFDFTISDPVKGSLKAELKAYPNILSDLMDGVASVFREPYGCFEQTSSSTYPNVMALQYLRETGTIDASIEKQALEYTDRGYKRLIGFETREGGFEWFGHTPAHEGLTAFGLLEFTEMKKVYPQVSNAMIERTLQWLLSRKDGKGGFKQNQHGMDGFYGTAQEVMNAYIVYALTEIGTKTIRLEYETTYDNACRSGDLYLLALAANASFNLGETVRGNKALTIALGELTRKGWDRVTMKTSLTYSYGKSLQMETASLLLLALLKTPNPSLPDLQALVKQLTASRCYGGFGSTQATILSLKALTGYARFSKHTAASGNILVYLGSELVGSQAYEKDARGEIAIVGLEKYMTAGKQPFRVLFADTKDALPYSVNVTWNSHTPNSAAQCNVSLETRLASPTLRSGETVRMTTILKNKTNRAQPMTVALVGIPSGLSPQPWQLKELIEKKMVDFYEVRKNYVVFYYRTLSPDAMHTISLDLKAEVPGVYQAPASTAYLYYTNEFKHWEAGEKVTIQK